MLSDSEKANLDKLRQDLIRRTGPQARELSRIIDEVDLSNISPDDLKSLCRPEFIIGVNFKDIDTSPPFTTADMNRIAPGAIDVAELKAKMSNQSMLQARVVDVLDTQSGTVAVTSSVLINVDVEDEVQAKTESQGINLQLINRALAVNAEATSNKEIKSRFVE